MPRSKMQLLLEHAEKKYLSKQKASTVKGKMYIQ